MAYRMAPELVTLNDLEGHSPVVGLFKCNRSNICAVFYQMSSDSALARSLSDSWASCRPNFGLKFGVKLKFKTELKRFGVKFGLKLKFKTLSLIHI